MDEWKAAKKRAASYGIDVKRKRKSGWSPQVKITVNDGMNTVQIEGDQASQATLLNKAIDQLFGVNDGKHSNQSGTS